MWIPESPRWLMIHGHPDQAHAIVDDIERSVIGHDAGQRARAPSRRSSCGCATTRRSTEVARTLFSTYRQRSLVGLALMVAQAFFYNAIFFTYALVLTDFYGIAADQVGWYILPFAAGNFLGPAAARPPVRYARPPHHDRASPMASPACCSRSPAICSRSACSSAQTQTIAWMVIFFFASPAASAAYLTVSETFPLEVRALAIALFYAIGTGIGGVIGPALFGVLIDTGSRTSVFAGYLLGAVLMIAAAGSRLALCGGRRAQIARIRRDPAGFCGVG